MNARERLAAMIRTNKGDMTVWSPREAKDALNEFAASILHGAADVAAAVHPRCDLKVCNACGVRHDILAALRGTADVIGENPGREAAIRANALKLFLFHLEQSAGDHTAEKLLEDAPALVNLLQPQRSDTAGSTR